MNHNINHNPNYINQDQLKLAIIQKFFENFGTEKSTILIFPKRILRFSGHRHVNHKNWHKCWKWSVENFSESNGPYFKELILQKRKIWS